MFASLAAKPLTPTRHAHVRARPPAALEPATWAEWSLQDVGVLDGAALALVAAGVWRLGAPDDEAADEVAEAEAALRESVLNSPCNGPSIEALEQLEAADAKAARRRPRSDPNELPGLFARRRRSEPSMAAELPGLFARRRGGEPRMAAEARRVSDYLRAVPLARRSVDYFASPLATGAFEPVPPRLEAWRDLEIERVLELSAGRRARWASAVAAVANVTAADLSAPNASSSADVECIACDNAQLQALADARPGQYDLVFASHALCTCEWVTRPLSFAAITVEVGGGGGGGGGGEESESTPPPGEEEAVTAAAATTCGGVALDDASVDRFVAGVAGLLRPRSGVALFDQEGGWPWGLERRLRAAAGRHGLSLYVRRGIFGTNFDYLLTAAPLVDDVSRDPLQIDARVVDAAFGLVAAFALALLFAPDATIHAARPLLVGEDALTARRAVALLLGARLLLPFCDVLTTRDLLDRFRP